jgi:hypothetical protein
VSTIQTWKKISNSTMPRVRKVVFKGPHVANGHLGHTNVHLRALPGAHYHHGHRHVHPHVNSVHHHPHYSHINIFFVIVAVVVVLGAIVGVSVWAYLNAKNTSTASYEERIATNMMIASKESEEPIE